MAVSKGRFVWFDLMTTDVGAAKAFYTETIGWKTQAWEGGDEPYTMFCVGEQPIGGEMTLPDEAKAMGAPPHWLGYVGVPDVDAAAKQAEELGGTVMHPGTDIPEVGRFAVLADPQGAVFAIFTPAMEMPMHDGEPRPGDMSWHELNTTDYEGAWTFYSTMFGWKATESMDMGPELGAYFMFQRDGGGDGSMGGMSNMAKSQGFPAHWLYYTTVDDLEATLERVKSNGGQVVNGPMEVPGGDRVAQCVDPQGCMFALHWRNA